MSKSYYESQKTILDRMLSKQNLSANEGDISYILQSPVSIEIEKLKSDQDEIINRNNIISAYENGYEEEVVRYAIQDGVDRKSAKNSTGIETFTGTVGAQIPVGTKFGNESNGLMYETVLDGTIGSNGSVDILSVSTAMGYKYNAKADTLTYMPIKLVGITGCTNKEDFTGGLDIESIDDLFYRHQKKVRTPATSGNKYHYENWALEVSGVGYAKCIPAEINGVGTVKVIIASSNKRAASDELMKTVYDYIESVRPVLAGELQVTTVEEINVDVSVKVELDNSVKLDDIKNKFIELLNDYFENTVYESKKVSVQKIGALLMSIDGVNDYSDLKINNQTSNITLSDNQIAVLNNTDVGVI